jgi:hypothetical protein
MNTKYSTTPSTEDRLLNVKVWKNMNKDNAWVQFISKIWIRRLARDLSLEKVGLTHHDGLYK